MAKISSFMISMVITSLFVTAFMIFLSDGGTRYNASFSNESYEVFNRMEELNNQTQAVQKSATGIAERSGVTDVIGSFFTAGFKVLVLTTESFDIFRVMLNQGIDVLNMGAIGIHIKIAFLLIVLIIIVLGIFVSTVIRKEV